MFYKLAVLLCLIATPGVAQRMMTVEEFEAFVLNHSLYFEDGGRYFGAEHFYPGRKTVWRRRTDECQEGTWYPRGQQICFSYPGHSRDYCWHFHWTDTEGRLQLGRPDQGLDPDYFVTHRDTIPVTCTGPELMG